MNVTALRSAVKAMCPVIHEQIVVRARSPLSDRDLWLELAGCLLSSQVPFEMAAAATEQLRRQKLLPINFTRYHKAKWKRRLENTLSEPFEINGGVRHYRFPRLRAEQIVEGASNISSVGLSLRTLTYSDLLPAERRAALIDIFPGVGPKQSSMFLRNAGSTYDLAILDTHVLRYMKLTKIIASNSSAPTNLKGYERLEAQLRNYAENLGYALGCVDIAIWTVMRVANREYSL
jgi:N-glycosylase/DNA lyase